ncbi:PIG-L deacetylase family protein [Nocardia transvalensis]|uniref:PIG-L deacetylase family protein n=1 Tax=Nocardia transvalensis TaxID=37333 RepID=UPI001893E582|nr:PIG-L family deacetylase [Nocardia transvalensis]MBF6327467.1 PIG-L family deacetylase [Nocardia transvalensis]
MAGFGADLVLTTAGRVVVVAPHFDDAVLALGASIAALVAGGKPVQVLTVFSGARDDERHGERRQAFADYVVRRAEDDRAMRVLGTEARRLGLFERIFREPPPRGPSSMFRTPADIARSDEVYAIRTTLTNLVDDDAMVLAPLGIGHHVDHVMVAAAALQTALQRPGTDRLLFYEDFNAVSERCRRHHPISRLHPFPFRDAPGWASPRVGCAMAAASVLAGGPDPAAAVGLSVRPEQWEMCVLPVGPGHESTQFCALAEYRTQTRALGGEPRLHAVIHRAHARRGGELVWRFRGGDGATPPG